MQKASTAYGTALTINRREADQMDFSVTYMKNMQVVVVQSKNMDKLDTLERLLPYRSSPEAGSAGEDCGEKHSSE
jgi:hypothetical protein